MSRVSSDIPSSPATLRNEIEKVINEMAKLRVPRSADTDRATQSKQSSCISSRGRQESNNNAQDSENIISSDCYRRLEGIRGSSGSHQSKSSLEGSEANHGIRGNEFIPSLEIFRQRHTSQQPDSSQKTLKDDDSTASSNGELWEERTAKEYANHLTRLGSIPSEELDELVERYNNLIKALDERNSSSDHSVATSKEEGGDVERSKQRGDQDQR